MPSTLDFDANYTTTVSHLLLLRSAVAYGIKIRRLAFERLEKMSTSAALALASEIDQWNQKRRRLRAALHTWHPNIYKIFTQMGFFELLGLPKQETMQSVDGATFLPFRRGVVSKTDDGGAQARLFRQEIEAITGVEVAQLELFAALSEAMTNVGQHAYDNMGARVKKQWWLSASFNHKTRLLKVTFLDHGRTIPKTLPLKWDNFEKIKDIFNTMSDAAKIKAAVTMGRSRTRQAHRGKGLRDLMTFAMAYPQGSLAIFSRKGKYWVRPANDVPPNFDPTQPLTVVEEKLLENRLSIGGTLIEWAVTI